MEKIEAVQERGLGVDECEQLVRGTSGQQGQGPITRKRQLWKAFGSKWVGEVEKFNVFARDSKVLN